METESNPNFIENLKEKNISLSLIASGAGAGIQKKLWIPGASKFLHGCYFPYSRAAKAQLLGFSSEQEVCIDNAIDLACAAYMQATSLHYGGPEPVGVGLTCAVQTDRERKGSNRMHLCIITKDKVVGATDEIIGLSSRELSNEFIEARTIGGLVECFEYQGTDGSLSDLTERAYIRILAHPHGMGASNLRLEKKEEKAILYPGSFNPPHETHFGIMDHILHKYNRISVPMITIEHPEKGRLSVQEVLKRMKLLSPIGYLIDRNNSLYIEKAQAYPDTPIVMGADAMKNMLDPKWGDPKKTLYKFAQLGTTFFVSPRGDLTVDNIFDTMGIDSVFRLMFQEIDFSGHHRSTEIRKAANNETIR